MSSPFSYSGRVVVAALLLGCLVTTAPLVTQAAQAAQAPVVPEPRLLAAGWNALVNGDTAAAARIAAELAQSPVASSSAAAVAFMVEAAIAGTDGQAGLTAYERWLGARTVEAPYTLRRIALALLRETAARQDSPLRTQALAALARNGDEAAGAQLAAGIARGDMNAVLAGAAAGDPAAVDALTKRLASQPAGPGAHERLIDALAESGSERAVAALTGLLANQQDGVRAAAATALGRLSAREAIPELRGLLDHYYPAVRLAAAGALYKMGDDSGRQVLQTFASSEYPGVRIGAAEAMASRPDSEWRRLVRELVREGDPAIRVQAARLLAPHDADAAGEALAALMRDPNPAIREAAAFAAASAETADFAALRRVLRGADQRAQVQAADRVLTLTR
ncbi:hypothetical protein BH23PLA1_BH23PLA1_37580 [soil metagenome]